MFEDYLALWMVLTLFSLLLLGFPVAFTLGGVATAFGLYGLELRELQLLPQRVAGIMENITLLAVPLFVFMGVVLEKSGLAEDLLESLADLFGNLKSGLAVSVVLAGALLAASTGIVGASVVTMGLISLPVMLKHGYSARFSSGLICASGTLGQIIPPSIVLVLLGDIVGQGASDGSVSVGRLFMAAIVPGLILVSLYVLWSLIYCRLNPPSTEESGNIGDKAIDWGRTVRALLAPLALMIAVLGSIFLGIASPTEAAAVGAFGGLFLAAVNRKLSKEVLSEVVKKTSLLTSMVFMILVGATMFGLVFRLLDGDGIILDFIYDLDVSKTAFIVVVMALLFVLGCFLDFIEIVFIVVPIILPVIEELGINPLWFAIMIAVNLQMSFLTPPLGFALFFLKGVAPEGVSTGDIYRGVLPFVFIQALVLILLAVFPELVTGLPDWWDERFFEGR